MRREIEARNRNFSRDDFLNYSVRMEWRGFRNYEFVRGSKVCIQELL